MRIGSSVRIINHHVKELNGLTGIILGLISDFNYRIWIEHQRVGLCGPFIHGDRWSVCNSCRVRYCFAPPNKPDWHQWLMPSGLNIGMFVVEVNKFNLKEE